ncbi:MAG TPA: DNA ligase D [Candidatus Saccharimonadales bacterium]|nr:DNA ligase D [Candidatus Saccharimonadales bacterium]
MGLGKYFAKRKFAHTPEPKGKVAAPHKKLAFVVQEHHASQLHYDFRLELDGVLKSWAVPKGPSMNPHERHLAVQVEDHPFAYRTFEGTIPEGNYGAGEVIIWDQGTYWPRAETTNPTTTLRQELANGHLTFVLDGQKLHGEFALIKLDGADKDAWLLIKKGDEYATTKDITTKDESVVSGKKVDELAEKPTHLEAFPKKALPRKITPMLTTLVDEPFTKDGWLFEMKWDGYRAIGTKHKDEVELYSRNGLDFSEKFAAIAEALRSLKHEVVVDGEIVVTDETGRPHFERLQNWGRKQEGTLQYCVFDILWYDGRDIREMPLHERKKLLRSVIPKSSQKLIFSDDVVREGESFFRSVAAHHLEGMVAKRADSTYQAGIRGGDWLKVKTHLRQEVVIGGFTEGRGTRTYLGALLVGVYHRGKFEYVGHVNAGMPDDERRLLRDKLNKLEQPASLFEQEPKPNGTVHWVRPRLVCEVSFSEWTSENMLRQPEFEGLRPDKNASEVHREKPKKLDAKHPEASPAAKKPGATAKQPFAFTHLDKLFWPERGYTKGDLIHYYESVSHTILPYLLDRPISMLRQPSGYKDHGFFQKDVSSLHLPPFVHTKTIFSESTNENVKYIVMKNLETLLYIVQLGSIEINPWSSRVPHLSKPDWAVIDLDPEGVTFKDVIAIAKTVHEVCEEWHIPHYPKTSGKTGIHIFIPTGGAYTYAQVRDFAHLIVLEVNKRQPKLTSLERNPRDRHHKIYLDYLQNGEGQTLASPYSVRPTKDASVSTPLHWDEVTMRLTPQQFTIKNTPARLQKVGDLWKPILGKGVDIQEILKTLS